MSRGIRNKGDIFISLNRVWSKKIYRFPMENYRYPMQKLTSVSTHYSESQKSTKGIDRDQIPSKANFSEKLLCIKYTEFLTNSIAECSTGSTERREREISGQCTPNEPGASLKAAGSPG